MIWIALGFVVGWVCGWLMAWASASHLYRRLVDDTTKLLRRD